MSTRRWLLPICFMIFGLAVLATPIVATAQSGVLFVENGRVGIGVATPNNMLHVVGTDNDLVFVNNTGATTSPRHLFTIQNNGRAQFGFTDNSGGSAKTWEFDASSILRINRGGSGVNEMQIFSGGNVVIAGTLSQNSNRDTKTAIEAVDPRQVLAKVAALPIATWVRKTDPEASVHMGPMAQDFAAAFGLGRDDVTIGVGDMAGVGLAAIQGLEQELADRDRRIADLEARLARLEAALTATSPE